MPDTMNVQVTASLLGRSYNDDQSVTGENVAGSSPNVTPAKSYTLTLRTDNDTGELTFADATHGVITGDKIDLYWTVGGVEGTRRNMTVGTVAGAVVPIDGGSGDNLPALSSTVVAKVPQVEGTVAIVGANVVGITVKAPSYKTQVVFRTSAGAEILAVILAAGDSYTWNSNSGVTNPVTGQTVAKISFSHADTSGTQETPAYLLYN